METKYIFLGGIFPETIENEVYEKSKTGVQAAADKLQKLILRGFSNKKIPIQILNSMFIGSYPQNYSDMIINSFDFIYEGNRGKNVGFINVFIIKHIYKMITLTVELYKVLKSTNEKKIQILIYCMHTPLLFSAVVNKIINKKKNINLCVFVPDLPQYMNTTTDKTNWLKKIDEFVIKFLTKKIDKFILITDKMGEALELTKDRYIVIEGMCEFKDYLGEGLELKDKKIILYTGTLNKKYGIIDLLEAFTLIKNENYELWICGRGDSENIVRNFIISDKRIKYLGELKNSEVVKLQKKATVLINPRPNNEEFTKYSFPSKIMEYYYSGTPVIMKKLDGIPEEYYEYCFAIDDVNIESFSQKIDEILQLDSKKLKKIGNNAKDFIIKNKSNVVQIDKIHNFLNNSDKNE